MSSAGDSDATTQPPSSRPRHSGRKPLGSRTAMIRAWSIRTSENAPCSDGRTATSAPARSVPCSDDLAGEQLGDEVAVAPDRPRQHARRVGQRRGVGQVAVVAEGEVDAAGLAEHGLGVAPGAGAGGRVAGVADGEVARQPAECPLVEDVGDETHVLDDGDRPAVRHRDPRRLLPAVLEGVEAQVGEVGDGLAGGVHAEDAAGLLQSVVARLAPSPMGLRSAPGQCGRPIG